MRVSPILTNFTAGELSPRLEGRVDVERYHQGVKTLENFLVHPHGGAQRRAGTRFIAEVKDSSKAVRLVPFVFNEDQAYVLEMGDYYLRFYADQGRLVAAGATPYEIASPYSEDEIGSIKFAQSADIMYLAHPNHEPYKLSRHDHTDWTLDPVIFAAWPTGDERVENGSMATSGGWTLGTGWSIVSGATGYANCDGSQSATSNLTQPASGVTLGSEYAFTYHISTLSTGSVAPLFTGQVGAARSATGTYLEVFTATTGGTTWGMSAGTGFTGRVDLVSVKTSQRVPDDWAPGDYPSAVNFFEQRLWWAGSPGKPLTVWASRSGGEYESFEPGVEDDDALTYTIASPSINRILWLEPHKRLVVGTLGGECTCGARSSLEPVTPTNVRFERETTYGSQNIQGRLINQAVIFVGRHARTIREFSYAMESDGYQGRDLTLLAEHVTGEGVTSLEWAQDPDATLWVVRKDGQLLAGTYYPPEQVQAWGRHITDGEFEDVCVIPGGDRDEVWLLVKRTINGGDKRFVELMEKPETEYPEDAFFVDSGLTMDFPVNIATASTTNPVLITTAEPHGFLNDDRIRITRTQGMTELNGRKFTVASAATLAFELSGVDGSSYTAYDSGGQARLCVESVAGLDHLEGKTVQVLADGAVHPERTVSGGQITLQAPASHVHAGLGYVSKIQTMRLDYGAPDGTAQGKKKRIHSVVVRFYKTVGAKVGTEEGNVDAIPFRTSFDPMDSGISPFTEDKIIKTPGTYNRAGRVVVIQDLPMPSTVLAIMPQLNTFDQ